MKTFNVLTAIAMLFLFLGFTQQTQACHRSSLMIREVSSLGGDLYRIDLTMCAGGGFENGAHGGEQHTGNVGFLVYGADITGYSPSYTSPQTGATYNGALYFGDSLLGFIGYQDWFANINTGVLQDVCADLYIITQGLPDSIAVLGVEGADNIYAGCTDSDMRVIPGCLDFYVNGGNYNVYDGYTQSYACAMIDPIITGATGPFTYGWSTGESTPTINVCPTEPETYTVTVTDASGCQRLGIAYVDVEDVHCGNGGTKVVVCRNGNTYCVSSNRVESYLNQGATLGACGKAKTAQMIEEFDETEMSLAISPNPVKEMTQITFKAPVTGEISVKIFDLTGKEVATIFEGTAQAGLEMSKSYTPISLPKGMYIARLTAIDSGSQVTQKMMIQ